MSLQNQIVKRRIKRLGPIGKVVGLLTAGFVSLIGLAAGLSPEVILLRALIASITIGSIVGFGISVIHVANTKRE